MKKAASDVSTHDGSSNSVKEKKSEVLRLHVNGLPPKKDENELRKHVENLLGSKLPRGSITDVKVIRKVSTGNSRRFGFIGCRDIKSRDILKAELDKTFWENSQLQVAIALRADEVNLFECSSEISRKKAKRIKDGWVKTPTTLAQKTKQAKRDEVEESNKNLMGTATRILVENLPYQLASDEIKSHFTDFGEIVDFKMLKDELTETFIGKLFIEFETPDSVEAAIKFFESPDAGIAGRNVWVQAVRKQTDFDTDEHKPVAGASSAYKRVLDKQKRREAEDAKQWNLLYISSHAAVSNMAKRLGVDPDDLMALGSNDSLAGRAAIAESHLVLETKKWLSMYGINEDSFIRTGTSLEKAKGSKSKSDRSKDTIIIKHLPEGVTRAAIQSQFQVFGSLTKVLVSPSQTIAIVEYMDDADANAAFHKLLLTPLKTPGKRNLIPMYLEWAPISTFDGSAEGLEAADLLDTSELLEAAESTVKVEDETKAEDETKVEEYDSEHYLYVANISFKSSADDLRVLFSTQRGYKGFKLSTKKRTNRDGSIIELSSGFGFCYFDTAENMKNSLQKMNGVSVDGHLLSLEVAKQKAGIKPEREVKSESGALMYKGVTVTSKLIVKNLPFQATEADVKKIFSAAGMVKSVRLPVNQEGRIKGFGFIEMASEKEALSAMQILGDTHLYGRRLAIDFAQKTDTSITAQTARAKNVRSREYEANKPRDSVKRRLRLPEEDQQE
eukprot:GHVH01004951.1.p1 GENE.GHVH01004951.1~~GHVH01004951.1.p1  ORF type:complete len:728 (+),score=119.93 GHVH01004951.1:1215-3398(+)